MAIALTKPSTRIQGGLDALLPVHRTHLVQILSLIALLPLLWTQIRASWVAPWMWFAPMALVVLVVHCWLAPKTGFAASPIRRKAGVSLMCLGIMVGLLGAFFVIPVMGLIAAYTVATGWLLIWLGCIPWTRIVATSALMWITWQPPFGLGTRLLAWLESQALNSAGKALDVFGTHYFLNGASLDLASNRLELQGIMFGWNSIYLLTFATLVFLIKLGRPLFLGILTLISIPAICWAWGTLHVLILVWASEAGHGNWLEGWPSVLLSSSRLTVELGCVILACYGWSTLWEPIPGTPTEIRKGMDFLPIYNYCVMWPMQFATFTTLDGRAEADLYETGEEVVLTHRAIPNVDETKEATDPWGNSRLLIPAFVCILLTGMCGLIAIIPTKQADEILLVADLGPSLATAQAALQVPENFDVSAPSIVPKANELGYQVLWSLKDSDRNGSLALHFPNLDFRKEWLTLEKMGWSATSPLVREEVNATNDAQVPVLCMEFRNDLGSSIYACFTAIRADGTSAVPTDSIWERLNRRFTNSVVGRLLGKPPSRNLFQAQLVMESQKRFTTNQRQIYRELLVSFAQAAVNASVTTE